MFQLKHTKLACKNLHFVKSGKKGFVFWGNYWQFRLSGFLIKVLNFYEGDIVVDYQKIK